jgi:hypothetical protein
MELNFEEFLRVCAGEFDGHLHEELRKLTPDQLEQLALRLAERTKDPLETHRPRA